MAVELVLKCVGSYGYFGDEARFIDSVFYMEPLFKVRDLMGLKRKDSHPFPPACVP